MAINNYSAFVLDTDTITTVNTEAKAAIAKKKAAAAKPAVTYHFVGISGCDFILEKKTQRSHYTLVCFVSKGQCYIKNEKTEAITLMGNGNDEEFYKFFKEWSSNTPLQDDDGNKLSWISSFYKSRYFVDWFMTVMDRSAKCVQQLITKGLFYVELRENDLCKDMRPKEGDIAVDAIHFIYKALPESHKALFRYIVGREYGVVYGWRSSTNDLLIRSELEKLPSIAEKQLKSLMCYMTASRNRYNGYEKNTSDDVSYANEFIYHRWGQSGLKSFISEYVLTPIDEMPSDYNWTELDRLTTRKNLTFEFNAFKEYILYKSVQQGFANDLRRFVSQWTDTLDMEYQVYGKITDKYPDNLATVHMILSYKRCLIQDQINEQLWEESKKNLEKYTYKGHEYSILAPQSKSDVVSESVVMSNCLSSYVEKIMKGATHIFYLRKNDDIESALVDIEVDKYGNLRQAYRAYNKPISVEEDNFIQAWMKKVFLPIFTKDKEPEEAKKCRI